jgi:hypothetical protein
MVFHPSALKMAPKTPNAAHAQMAPNTPAASHARPLTSCDPRTSTALRVPRHRTGRPDRGKPPARGGRTAEKKVLTSSPKNPARRRGVS